MFLKNQWQEWAREWGLAHYPEKGWLRRTERVVGERQGLLIRVGWGNDQSPGLVTVVRFPRVADPAGIRQALIDDPTLDALPGKGSARRKMAVESGRKKTLRIGEAPEFVLTNDGLVWRRTFAFGWPKATHVQAWVDALVAAVARATPVFNRRCETCGTGSAGKYVLVDDLPTLMCSSCQQRLRAEGEMAARTYEMMEARHLPGFGLALLAALVGAVVWGTLGVVTGRIFAIAAIGIGALVAWAYRFGAGRVDPAGRAIAAGVTLLSVVLGELFYYTWMLARLRPEIGFDFERGLIVYARVWAENPGSQVITLLFGLAGAWVATQVLAKPKLAAQIEAAGSPESEARKAA